jgi:hypothetical protein
LGVAPALFPAALRSLFTGEIDAAKPAALLLLNSSNLSLCSPKAEEKGLAEQIIRC